MMTLNHGFSGYVASRVAKPLLQKQTVVAESTLTWAVFLGAMSPDIDIIARLVGQSHYFGSHWYSHRVASHSLLGVAVLAGIFVLISRALARRRGWTHHPATTRQGQWWLFGLFWVGGTLHILGDLFTPGMPMRVLWPLEPSFGSWAHIGWYSPFLTVLFLAAMGTEWILGKLPDLAARHPLLAKANLVWVLHTLTFGIMTYFLITSRYTDNAQWMEVQNEWLPAPLVEPLFDLIRFLWGLIR